MVFVFATAFHGAMSLVCETKTRFLLPRQSSHLPELSSRSNARRLSSSTARLLLHHFFPGEYDPMETGTRDLEFNVVIEKDEDGYYVASVPALRGCHTQARSLDVLMKRVKEAIELCLEAESPVANEFIGVQRVVVAV